MGEVDVTPDDLRGSGESITGLREGIGDSGGFKGVQEHMQGGHYVMNDTGRMSGGFFNMSALADEFMFQRTQEMTMAKADIENNLYAVASALHIVADVYEADDLENAVEFAFVGSDVAPEGLPSYVDPDQTLSGMREEAEQEAEEEAGERDGSGNDNGSEPNGQRQPREEPFSINHPDGYGGSDTISGTRYYDGDGNLTHTEYVSPNEDGTYTVTTYDPNGEQTGEEIASPDINETMGQLQDESREEMERTLRDAGFDPDHPEDW